MSGLATGLTGRSVWITGASGGIGRAAARAFAAEGARLVLTARTRRAELEAFAAAELADADVLVETLDVTDPGDSERVAESALARFGRLDHAVVNAGVWPEEDVPLARMDPARLERTIAVDLVGAALTCRSFARALERTGPRPPEDPAAGGAAVVVVGSTAGRFGERGHADYAMAKAGLVGLVLSLKNELCEVDPLARVNLLEPGWTATEMAAGALADDEAVARALSTMALRKVAGADEVARAALVLCAPLLSGHVSGERVAVAGGMEGRRLWERHQVDPDAARRAARPGAGGAGARG